MPSNFKGLEKLQKNMHELSEKTEIKLTELMNPSFVASCSKFDSIEDLFDASGFSIESPEDFAEIPDDEWEEFIVGNTSFSSWNEMQQYTKQQLHKASNKALKRTALKRSSLSLVVCMYVPNIG
ncbi:hypothetical protein GHNINEIG_01166 [Hydrogenovibrio crunogenus]|uniref:Uncharacterized protein n=1 Tax=Hydrogenovibrio crunogenus TaxID=39765 RepID=A0A4P7P041_9GAMM|nr:hypothetical protein [Hydrogenovibrio crunogenus]QBZ83125.1 hypothetical protein GHNINEIG_01166 [Hydrogenovibrio crunogenus]